MKVNIPALFALASVFVMATSSENFEFDAEKFYESIKELAPDKSVLDALEFSFRNPLHPVLDENTNSLKNPCCPLHTSRYICDPACMLDTDEADKISKVAQLIVTASGCACKKVKYCTMQENGFRVFVIIVPTDFIRNVTFFIDEMEKPEVLRRWGTNLTLLTASTHEIIGKHAPKNPSEMLMEWLADMIRLFVWRNGRCDDDFVLAILHDHHVSPNVAVFSDVRTDNIMVNMNRISWSSGSAILNKSMITGHCLDEVFQPLRNYLHKPTHLRLSIRVNETSEALFSESIVTSLNSKAINRRDEPENPCYEHEVRNEDETGLAQRFKLLAFAGITSITLPMIACMALALNRCLSRRYCTEDPWENEPECQVGPDQSIEYEPCEYCEANECVFQALAAGQDGGQKRGVTFNDEYSEHPQKASRKFTGSRLICRYYNSDLHLPSGETS